MRKCAKVSSYLGKYFLPFDFESDQSLLNSSPLFRVRWKYTVNKGLAISCPQSECQLPNSPWPGIIYPIPVPGRFGQKKSRNLVIFVYSVSFRFGANWRQWYGRNWSSYHNELFELVNHLYKSVTFSLHSSETLEVCQVFKMAANQLATTTEVAPPPSPAHCQNTVGIVCTWDGSHLWMWWPAPLSSPRRDSSAPLRGSGQIAVWLATSQ